MEDQRISVIIDTDPGVDDLFAILSALGSRRLRVQAITTVGGNVGLDQVTRNALGILAMAGRPDIPVYPGAAGPLAAPARTASEVHGDDGLQGLQLPEPQAQPGRLSAAEYLCRAVRRAPRGSLHLACLGPLTNLALALRMEPELADWLRSIVVMGGGFGTFTTGNLESGGNVTPRAEFNLWADAEAAHEVVSSPLPLVFLPLDVSHRTLVTEERLLQIGELPVWGPALMATLRAYGVWTRTRSGTVGGPLHDPNVLAYLEAPELYGLVEGAVAVEQGQGPGRGESRLGPGSRHQVAHHVDSAGFFHLIAGNLRRALGG